MKRFILIIIISIICFDKIYSYDLDTNRLKAALNFINNSDSLKSFAKRMLNYNQYRIYVYDSTLFTSPDDCPNIIISLKYDNIDISKKKIIKDSLERVFKKIKPYMPIPIKNFNIKNPEKPHFVLFFTVISEDILTAEILPLTASDLNYLDNILKNIIYFQNHLPKMGFFLLFNKKNEIIKWYSGIGRP
jgi:hypothetical protein